MKLLHDLWNDEAGVVLSAELILILTIAVLGMVVGLTCLRDAIGGEFRDLGRAFRSLNQSYAFTGFHGCRKFNGRWTSFVAGSAYSDRGDQFARGEVIGGLIVAPPRREQYVAPAPCCPEVIEGERVIPHECVEGCPQHEVCPEGAACPEPIEEPCDECVPSEPSLEPIPETLPEDA